MQHQRGRGGAARGGWQRDGGKGPVSAMTAANQAGRRNYGVPDAKEKLFGDARGGGLGA